MNKYYDHILKKKKKHFWRTLQNSMKRELLTLMHINFKVGRPNL